MVRDTVDAVVCVEVFVKGDLEEGSASLPGDDGGPGEEEDPDAVPAVTIGSDNLVLVRDPVLVPVPDGGRVVNTEDVNVLDLKAVIFELTNDPVESAACIGTREDIFVHEQTPDEILVLPDGADTSDLEDEDTIVVEEIIDLTQELTIATDTDVFSHLERDNLVKGTWSILDITEVLAENASLGGVNTVGLDAGVSEGGLLAGEGNAGSVDTVVLGSKGDEGTPSASNVQETIAGLEAKFLADDGELVILELFEGFSLGEVGDDTTRVDHTWP